MTFFVKPFARTLLPPLAAALGSMGAVLAVSTLATAGGTERWSLRPKATAPATTPATTPVVAEVPLLRGTKSIPLSALPGERRTVRIVYQGYLPAEAR
ncbi:hypothetical protein [Methylorubrum populi]|uniref:PEGA domain-containing protein n=1 Tax=Methylorubrum populi TaxID=223967 RepID=A0A921E6B7_9HYPH|nr:hypothetical protein [Methylorubrum populi]